jgi:uncharacterized membrane protein (DUF2068 family)
LNIFRTFFIYTMRLVSGIPLKLLALFEAAKGILVVLVGAGLLTLIHKNFQIEAADVIRFFHLNPARHYPEIFLHALANLSNTRLWFLSVSALLYSLIRFAEAYGLWFDRAWAVWFAVASSGLFLPMEIFELSERYTLPRLSILIINILLILILLRHIQHDRLLKK